MTALADTDFLKGGVEYINSHSFDRSVFMTEANRGYEMSVESVRALFKGANLEELVLYSAEISDTVEHAAALLGCRPAQIAKTMSLIVDGAPVVIVASGDAKIDNSKYKAAFGVKAKMIPYDEVEFLTGHIPGGICPFALKDGVKVYLDLSLRRFEVVYTGGGDEHNTVKVTIEQLERYSNYTAWIDVCKNGGTEFPAA